MKSVKTILAAVIFLSSVVASAECKNQINAGRFAMTSPQKVEPVKIQTAVVNTPAQPGKR